MVWHGEEADVALKDGFDVRSCPENDYAYVTGALPDIRTP